MENSAPGPVEVGYLPTRLPLAPAPDRRLLVQRSDEAGLDHIAVGDHVSFYGGIGCDALVASVSVLANSDRLRANTGVYLLPLRHPAVVARQIADISVLAPSRFRFGVGIGGEDPHEFEICGIDPKTRGRRMDECMHLLRRLLTGDPVDHDGEFFRVNGALIAPAPRDQIPLIVGGRSDAAIRRAGRYGDGWFAIWVSPTRFESSVALMTETANDAGRSGHGFTNALNVWCGVDTSTERARQFVATRMEAFYRLPYERFEKWSPFGRPGQIVAFLHPYAAAGCTVFNLIIQGESAEQEIEAVAEIREGLLDAMS